MAHEQQRDMSCATNLDFIRQQAGSMIAVVMKGRKEGRMANDMPTTKELSRQLDRLVLR